MMITNFDWIDIHICAKLCWPLLIIFQILMWIAMGEAFTMNQVDHVTRKRITIQGYVCNRE